MAAGEADGKGKGDLEAAVEVVDDANEASSSSQGASPSKKSKKELAADKPKRPPVQWPKRGPFMTFVTRFFFLDVDPLILQGYRQRLEPEDMYRCPDVHTQDVYSTFAPQWQAELAKPEPDIKKAILAGNKAMFIYTGLMYALSQACTLAGPLILRQIVQGLQCYDLQDNMPYVNFNCAPKQELYYYCIGLFLAPAIQSFAENHQTYYLYLIGTRMRNALMAAIYRKCLRLSNASLQAQSTGKVVTLMSNDAQKLQDAMMAIHAMWGSPCFIIAVLTLLWFEVGWATFVGLGVMLFITPLTGKLAAKLGGLRREILQWTDKRVGIMSEIINSMQMIKFYAWERPFRAKVGEARSQEARILRTTAFWQGLFGVLLFSGPVLVAIFCFGSWTVAGNELTTAKAYTALSLFSLLRFPMSFLPMLITMVVNALVALKRIAAFLRSGEAGDPIKPKPPPEEEEEAKDGKKGRKKKAKKGQAQADAKPASPGKTTEGGPNAAAAGGSGTKDEKSSPVVVVADAADTATAAANGQTKSGPGPVAEGAQHSKPASAAATADSSSPANGSTGKLAYPETGTTTATATAGGMMSTQATTVAGSNGESDHAVGSDQVVAQIVDVSALPPCEPGYLSVQAASFTWDEYGEKVALRDVDFAAQPGTLTMVVGSVGSGKSSLLNALVGHITRTCGSVQVGGRIAYVAQSAWIMNDTVQENVLLGSNMDPSRYRLSLDVSQLGPDLDILPNGDLTEIGDRGITLSGGQKQRVSIARAVYADADVYILDDPLSAVDSHVGRALFEQCVRGVLRKKTVVLVTNALQYLPHADNILWMEDGKIKAQGTYPELVASGLNIAELAHIDDDDEEDEDQDTAKTAPEGAKRKSSATGEGAKRKSVDKPAADKAKPGFEAAGKVTLTRQATDANRNLTGVEERESGNISWAVLQEYFSSGGGLVVGIIILVGFGAEQAARVYTDKWVGMWFDDRFDRGTWFYLGIYFLLGVIYGCTTFFRSLNFLFMCVRAAVNIHNKLLEHLLRLPKSFFDTNPAGRILNRFSRDTDIMDSTLSTSLIQLAGCVATYVSILVVIAISTYWFAIALVPLTIIYFIVQRYYIPTARELQRIESVTRSPIYSRFAEALQGVATIRAYRCEAHFIEMSDALMEKNAYSFMTQRLAAAWLAMRLDFIGLTVLVITGALVINGGISPGTAGLALMYALDLTRYLKHGTNMASKSEADFNSVERIVQYLRPETEAAPDNTPEVAASLDPEWPAKGALQIKDLHMRYRPNMPLVLRGVDMDVPAGAKVGLVGRTGSGKSSLFLALFRMVEAESGQIIIDGVDIKSLGLMFLRSKMSIIPQDPFMFSGTVRYNLDPFGNFNDERLWQVLSSVGLRPVISELEKKLDAPVVDNGNNFSLGQRQLFCLARAMLRRSRVVMLDEATASVDLDTDNVMQLAIRSEFEDCTLLTIAHRLHTIMDSDLVVVLDKGKVVEHGEPHDLLQKDAGMFTGMVSQTGRASSRYLKGLAASARSARVDSLRVQSVLRTGASFAVGMQPQDDSASPEALRNVSSLRLDSAPITHRAAALAAAAAVHGSPPAAADRHTGSVASLAGGPPERSMPSIMEQEDEERTSRMQPNADRAAAVAAELAGVTPATPAAAGAAPAVEDAKIVIEKK